MLSIIMPSLNVGKYIEQSLRSVVSQTLDNIEIICVDAGSTDGTLQIIEEFAKNDKRIKLINSPIKSYGYQMNLGLDIASGEYIGIVETDDYIEQDMYKDMYFLAKSKNLDFVKGGYVGFVGETNTIERVYLDRIDKNMLNRVIDLEKNRKQGILSPVHIWSGIYRRQFLLNNSIRFNETPGASYQDTSFFLLVGMMAENCMYTDDAFYHYRMDNINSSVKSQSKISCVVDEFKYLVDKLISFNKYDKEIKEIVERYKLITYNFNYNRLNSNGRNTFLNIIRDEMSLYTSNSINWRLTSDELQLVEKLTNYDMIEENINEEEKFYSELSEIIKACKNGEKFNIVGAGKLFENLVVFKTALGIDFIASLSDNSTELQGNWVQGYLVQSVESVVNSSKERKWIVLNKQHHADIVKQLLELGIQLENIHIFTRMVDIDMIDSFCNYVNKKDTIGS